jgi:hypothetical protein
MNRFITPDRLLNAFAGLGFHIRQGASKGSFGIVRPTNDASLFEWIIVESAGRQHEAIAATVAVSVTKNVPFFRLMEMKPVVEIADDSFRGSAVVSSEGAADNWIGRLRYLALQYIAATTASRGAMLLEKTLRTRQAVEKYWFFLSLRDKLLDPAVVDSLNTRREAARLAEWPGVVHLFGADDVYLSACLTILRLENQVEESSESFMGKNPLINQELMWRIQLLVDRLLDSNGSVNLAC